MPEGAGGNSSGSGTGAKGASPHVHSSTDDLHPSLPSSAGNFVYFLVYMSSCASSLLSLIRKTNRSNRRDNGRGATDCGPQRGLVRRMHGRRRTHVLRQVSEGVSSVLPHTDHRQTARVSRSKVYLYIYE